MALYSMTQLVGKTILCNKAVDVYKVSSINTLGDNAKPVLQLRKGQTFTLDSWLSPRPETKRTDGSIMYAKRTYMYFTFFIGSDYVACIFKDDGRFSLDALKEQGAISVKEEIELKKKEDELFNNPLAGIGDSLGNIFKGLKPVIITILIVIVVIYLLPVILQGLNKNKQ